MRVAALKTLRDFWARHPDAEQALRSRHDEVGRAQWHTPADIKAHYGNASILKGRRVVFNIKGNAYPVVAAVAYNTGVVFKFVGTHAEYDRADAETVEYR